MTIPTLICSQHLKNWLVPVLESKCLVIEAPFSGMCIKMFWWIRLVETNDLFVRLRTPQMIRGPNLFLKSRNPYYGTVHSGNFENFDVSFAEYCLVYRAFFAKETFNFKEPTNRGHPICWKGLRCDHFSGPQNFRKKQALISKGGCCSTLKHHGACWVLEVYWKELSSRERIIILSFRDHLEKDLSSRERIIII